jgi:protein-S-isoprenylcysteine O-methyltransferase Ste14
VRHLTVWVETPLRRLDDPPYAPSDAADFPAPVGAGEEAWRRDIDMLGSAIERLAQRVGTMPDAALEAPVGDHAYTYARMIDGVAQHLAYHAGQVALIARTEETAGVIAPPPLIVLGAMLVAELAARIAEWRLGVLHWLGYAVAMAGMGLVWWAHEHFVKARTPAAPWNESLALVLGGPFRFTRNPMYIGLLLTQAGVGVMRSNAWYLAMVVPSWAILHWGVVLREERYLLKKFGTSYQQLLDTSRRWLL